jgi:hypothetical protein
MSRFLILLVCTTLLVASVAADGWITDDALISNTMQKVEAGPMPAQRWVCAEHRWIVDLRHINQQNWLFASESTMPQSFDIPISRALFRARARSHALSRYPRPTFLSCGL